MVKVLEGDKLRELECLLGKGIYKGYTLERMLREAPDAHYYLEQDGEVVACASIWTHTDMVDEKGVRAGAIGHFEAMTGEGAKEILELACRRLKEEGASYMIGPIDGSTWNSYRLVTYSDGSMPFLMEPQYKEGYSRWLEEAGFKPTYLYFSTKETIEEAWQQEPLEEDKETLGDETLLLHNEDSKLAQNKSSADIIVEKVNLQQLEEVLDSIYEISIQSFKQNLFYKPIDREAFKAMYRSYQQFLVADLILVAKKGDKPVGFIFSLPNYLDSTRRSVVIKTIAVLPEYRQEGIGKKLYEAVTKEALKLEFREFITALIYKENNSQRLCDGGKVIREYTLFRKELNHESC